MTDIRHPKVSVLMSVWNGASTLRASVESILGQTFAEFEFVIVDDGSGDETPDILSDLAAGDARVRLLCNRENLGLTPSLNRGLEVASGEYIARHDADDYSLPRRLAEQVAFLDRNPEVGVLGTEIDVIGEDGSIVGVSGVPETHGEIVWRFATCRPSLAHPSVMIRRETIAAIGGYDPDFSVTQDYDLWSRLMGRTRFANLPDVHVRYSGFGARVSARSLDEQVRNSERIVQRIASDAMSRAVSLPEARRHMRLFGAPAGFPPEKLGAAIRFAEELLLGLIAQGHIGGEYREILLGDIARVVELAEVGEAEIPTSESGAGWLRRAFAAGAVKLLRSR